MSLALPATFWTVSEPKLVSEPVGWSNGNMRRLNRTEWRKVKKECGWKGVLNRSGEQDGGVGRTVG